MTNTTENLDQSKFDTISFSGSRYYLDEIRIGLNFGSVVSGTVVDNFAADANDLFLAGLQVVSKVAIVLVTMR